MDSYPPKSVSFSQHYQESPGDFDNQEIDEGDIVKSKPQGRSNAYFPLVNEAPESRARLGSRAGGTGQVQSDPLAKSECQIPAPHGTYTPPNGRIPVVEPILSTIEPTGDSGAPTPGSAAAMLSSLSKVEPPPPLHQSARTVAREASPSDEEDRDREGLEDSTTALLRKYTLERNGRPTSIHLGPSGEIMGSGWLSEILVCRHKKCSVTLEEDSITWRFLSRKDGGFSVSLLR